jgi:IS30 family transposase
MGNYSRLTFEDRVKITIYRSEGYSYSEIAAKISRSKSTISREFARFPFSYEADKAHRQSASRQRSRRLWRRKMDHNSNLREEVMSGLRKRWSPEQISRFLADKYPGDQSMQLSHEAIYTYIYVLPRGALRSELVSYLRQKKKARKNRRGLKDKRGQIPEMISITERPKSVETRSLSGHWEGDLILGKASKTALGTLVERKTRTLILVPLKANHRSPSQVRRAFERAFKTLPKQMRTSLTYDQGKEMMEHRLFTKNTKMKVYFCHPASPWERGTCENTNGLIRDYFPKKTDFSKISKKEIKRVQDELNERPRKTLGFRTPKEVFHKEILYKVPLDP